MTKRLLNLTEGEGIRTAVDVLITDEAKTNVLLGLRKSESGVGMWTFIGGHQKTGERIQETAIRGIGEK